MVGGGAVFISSDDGEKQGSAVELKGEGNP
jgi:hypothetical protein